MSHGSMGVAFLVLFCANKNSERNGIMIKKRLIQLLAHAKRHIVFQVMWKWLSLLCQIIMVGTVSFLLEKALNKELSEQYILLCGAFVAAAMLLRFFSDRQAAFSSVHPQLSVSFNLDIH